MAKIDLAKGLKMMQDSAKELKEAVQETKLPEVKMPEIKLPEWKTPEVKLPDVQELTDGIKNATENVKSAFKKNGAEEQQEAPGNRKSVLATDAALKILYFAMAADGKIEQEESNVFCKIGNDMDPNFEEHKEQILTACSKVMETKVDEDDFYDVIQDGVTMAIDASVPSKDSYITPKILLWNLLTVAYSDGDCSQNERRLIKYIVRKLDIDKTVFLELESSIQTIMDIEKEITWIKTTDRQYMEIEKIVNELTDRRGVVFDSAKDLITL